MLWRKEVDNDELVQIISADPLTTTREFGGELHADCSTVVHYLKHEFEGLKPRIEKVGVLMFALRFSYTTKTTEMLLEG